MSDEDKTRALITHRYDQDWLDDCARYRGKILRGVFSHWCVEWDYLPIDETCEEFRCCRCYERVIKERTVLFV